MLKKGKNKSRASKSRKQQRKDERKNKKLRRHEYYTNRRKPGQFVLINNKKLPNSDDKNAPSAVKQVKKGKSKVQNTLELEKIRDKERKQQKKLQEEMNKQRKKQLIEANIEEDRTIKYLEKQLKIDKRKSKSIPASFKMDGLDYLLEVCDSDTAKSSAFAEQQLTEVNDEFEEDLALMIENSDVDVESDKDFESFSSDDENSGSEDRNIVRKAKKRSSGSDRSDCKRKRKLSEDSVSSGVSANDEDEDDIIDVDEDSQLDVDEDDQKSTEKSSDRTWEDIYGRLRAVDGSVINLNSQKYLPPAARMNLGDSSDKMRNQKLDRLKRQLKGLINKLAESNMHNIATQIEELYMNNSRNDMNSTITSLILEALVTNILTPERLLMEHILLVTILHTNIGIEVGAHFLQIVVKLFNEQLKNSSTENKKLDNLVIIIAQLYNFKLFDSKLIFDVLNKFIDNFEEKNVECILHILRNVGFNLRKDDPVAMKNLILSLQKKASSVSNELKDNSRVRFMIDVLLAIKNNNVSKIPNYDTSYSEHLKKIVKSFLRKGKYITQLNISLEDLLKADMNGKWWVVGSAWTGNNIEANSDNSNVKDKPTNFSQNLLELAKKQRMNTDTRKNIFCIIMSSEDYLDAFEKLLRLSLKNQQEREIIHVLLHCCLQEKKYNPFYAVLAQKFCEYDRKYQMTIKYSIWDKLKCLTEHSASQISNLAKLLSFLFMEKGLPISILKVVEFSDLDKVSLRFMRQILLKILLHEDLEMCKGVFEKVSQSDKLKMFRESLRLFMHHFLLKNLKSQQIPHDKTELLQQRVKIVEKLLSGKEIRI